MVTSEIPVGAGLGSSAAYSVALAGAFHRLNVGGGLKHHAGDKPPSTLESFAPDDQVIQSYIPKKLRGFIRTLAASVEFCLTCIAFLLQIISGRDLPLGLFGREDSARKSLR